MRPSLQREIVACIQERGRITFAEFMELALFSPQGGYYTSLDRVGAAGDYFTSGAAHPVFGALIVIQLHQIWELMGAPDPFFVLEMGAGNGLLAQDVMDCVERSPTPFQESVRYLALEQRLSVPTPDAMRFTEVQPVVTSAIPLRGIVGCFLSNELLDSFPVHRFQINKGRLKEVYVTLKDDAFAEALDEPSTPLLEERIDSLGLTLPEGFRGEVNLGLGPWMAEVAQALKRGFVITIDYGYPARELYSPQRARGTLQCYFKHTQSANPYIRIGQQDITAHVDFTSVIEEGKKHGIESLGPITQREFLNNLGMSAFIEALRSKNLLQREYYANRMAMQELVKPDGLGNFKVLVQSKGLDNWGAEGLRLYGLTLGNTLAREMEANVAQLDVPLLKPGHTPLMEGRYPHMTWEW